MPKWTLEEENKLKQVYATTLTKDLEVMFGRKEHAIKNKAQHLGLEKKRYFTDREINYINKFIGKKPIREISKNLGRSYSSVRRKICYMGLGGVIDNNESSFHLAEISRLVGRDKTTIQRIWVAHLGLPYKKVGKFYMINEKDLISFMKAHPDRWDATKCERWFFQQYDWFEEKRKQDFDKMIDRRWGSAK